MDNYPIKFQKHLLTLLLKFALKWSKRDKKKHHF